MSNKSVLDLEELFELNEEEEDVVQEKPKKKRSKAKEEVSATSDQAEEIEGEPSVNQGESPEKSGEEPGEATKQPRKSGGGKKNNGNSPAREPKVRPDGWNVNIIGVPPRRGMVNPYFEGVIAHDGLDKKAIFIPYKDIKRMERQVYVDDIHTENPNILATIYRVSGTFNDVVARITEDQYNEILAHKQIKLDHVTYSYVSDHRTDRPKRNYVLKHDKWPTAKELADIDKHEDEVEWHLLPWHEKDKLKTRYEKSDEYIEEFPEDQDETTDSEEDTEQNQE